MPSLSPSAPDHTPPSRFWPPAQPIHSPVIHTFAPNALLLQTSISSGTPSLSSSSTPPTGPASGSTGSGSGFGPASGGVGSGFGPASGPLGSTGPTGGA